jgi:ABC-type dipeptide/oligopeptide/nickel transport system permease subunit
MATTTSPNKIANIKADTALPPSESLFQSALKRLLRNRFAVMGIVIIIMFLLIALFADVIAPYPYDQTALRASDSMPTWVSNLFGIAPKDAGGYAKINEDYSLGADNLGPIFLVALSMVHGYRWRWHLWVRLSPSLWA